MHGSVPEGKGGQVFLFWKIGGYFGISYPGIASVVFRMEEARRSNKQTKIEPSPLKNTTFSINAMTPNVLSITDFDILIEDKKLQYLTESKEGKLKKAGLINLNKYEIEKLIREKVSSNYIYNLTYLSEHNTIKFNVLIETKASDTGRPVKLMLSLEYKLEEKLLRLITMY